MSWKKNKLPPVKIHGGRDCPQCGVRVMQRFIHQTTWEPKEGQAWQRFWDRCECGHIHFYGEAYVKAVGEKREKPPQNPRKNVELETLEQIEVRIAAAWPAGIKWNQEFAPWEEGCVTITPGEIR